MFKKIGMFVTFVLVIASITAGVMYYLSKKEKLEEEFDEEMPTSFNLDKDLKETDDREYIPL